MKEKTIQLPWPRTVKPTVIAGKSASAKSELQPCQGNSKDAEFLEIQKHIWHTAYNELANNTPDLVEKFESVLNNKLGSGSDSSNNKLSSSHGWTLIQRFVQMELEKAKSNKNLDKIMRGAGFIQEIISLIDKPLQAVPAAGPPIAALGLVAVVSSLNMPSYHCLGIPNKKSLFLGQCLNEVPIARGFNTHIAICHGTGNYRVTYYSPTNTTVRLRI